MTRVTCIMPTAERRRFVPQAIRYFLAQDYPERELVIVDDGASSVEDLVPDDPRIRYFRHPARQPVGAKRNFACHEARGELIAHWDDDDWSAPWRLSYQVEQLAKAQADICGLNRALFYAPEEGKAWEYVYPPGQRPWVYGASLCYTRAFWQAHPFPEIRVGEDTRFVWADVRAKIHVLPDPSFLVALIHQGNTSPKRTGDARYQPRLAAEVERLIGGDLTYCSASRRNAVATELATRKPRALISAALGIGDILRVTPLIRVAHRLGYDVDVLLATDYPEAAKLLEGAPEVHRLFHAPSARGGGGRHMATPPGVVAEDYDMAAFTAWSASLGERVRARRKLKFDRARWLAEGDSRSVERIARELGWEGDMPEPFAMASARRFGLPPGTVAIHPGCKAEWPWKKWHGFDELAGKFANVAIVGTDEDMRTNGTYFGRSFAWPEHARNFVGQLSLPDTAALLRECAALVSNDSGLMHLAAALSVPAFGIFGITSPRREGMPSKHFFPITKGLPCEAACHAGTWGRRDCARHLECLRTLTADEVFMKITELVPTAAGNREAPLADHTELSIIPSSAHDGTHQTDAEQIVLAYYGNVFDASGYGQAARAYIHALHAAGVNVVVVDLANHARQVRDELVESLAGRRIDPDFHLFHGIPPQWARRAFPLRNVIAMTVWETDAMPPQWRPALNHALEVWMPCDFNVAVFERALEKPVFKLPHAWIPAMGASPPRSPERCGIRDGDFVFYSIFEWQERKGPREMIEAFLRAFPNPEPLVLVLKSNVGAAGLAATTLAELRRRVPSQARIELRCEAWNEEQIAALQERGDCYVSLHRGEGWNYPLFEAASRGKAIVATGYSGPLEYLDTTAHRLIRHTTAAVRQRYAYYSTAMHWAEPDVAHAMELLQTAYVQRDDTATRRAYAGRIQRDFSAEAIGCSARRRLLHLLRHTNPAKWRRIDTRERQSALRPLEPIPGTWYDADYFENGLKSNWSEGYSWPAFAGLFRDTAEFLTTMLPEAQSFLDAGCAKGFLVRTLRERGKDAWGFDHSPWAIEHAEEAARPFLQLAGVDDAQFGREFDVTVAFSLLENLTEEQTLEFLERARSWTRQALIVVVLLCEDEAKRTRLLEDDRDLAHATLQSRAWWHERFLRAGWRQDALHRVVERRCREHALPNRMGWGMFVFAP